MDYNIGLNDQWNTKTFIILRKVIMQINANNDSPEKELKDRILRMQFLLFKTFYMASYFSKNIESLYSMRLEREEFFHFQYLFSLIHLQQKQNIQSNLMKKYKFYNLFSILPIFVITSSHIFYSSKSTRYSCMILQTI